MTRIIAHDGPVNTTFSYETDKGLMEIACTLGGLSIDVDSIDESYDFLSKAYIFSNRTKVVVLKSEMRPDEDGNYIKFTMRSTDA